MSETQELSPLQHDTGEPAAKWYTWTFRSNANAPEQVFEFGMPLAEQDARNRVAAHLGLHELPGEAMLTHTTVSTPSPSAPTQETQATPASPDADAEILYEKPVVDDALTDEHVPPFDMPAEGQTPLPQG